MGTRQDCDTPNTGGCVSGYEYNTLSKKCDADTSCAAGLFSMFTLGTGTCYGSACTTCQNCPAGFYRDSCQGKSPGVCVACPFNTFTADSNSLSECNMCSTCPAGEFADSWSSTRDTSCRACPQNSTSVPGMNTGAVQSVCLCESNFYWNYDHCALCADPLCDRCDAKACLKCAGQAKLHYDVALGKKVCNEECPEGTTVEKIGDEGFSCKACTPCSPGEERVMANDPTSTPYCTVPCAQCSGGKYKRSAGIWSTTCISCQNATDGYFVSESCSATSDATVRKCSPCADGMVRSGCAEFSEGVCVDCPTGRFKEGLGSWNTTCEDCSSCAPNQYVAGAPCSAYHNLRVAQCTDCSVCPTHFYASTACSLATNTICTQCASCPAGEFRVGCEGASPGLCLSCDSSSFKSSAGVASTVCTTCSPCEVGSAASGGGEYESNGCTRTQDTQCSECPNKAYISASSLQFRPNAISFEECVCKDQYFMDRSGGASEAVAVCSMCPTHCRLCNSPPGECERCVAPMLLRDGECSPALTESEGCGVGYWQEDPFTPVCYACSVCAEVEPIGYRNKITSCREYNNTLCSEPDFTFTMPTFPPVPFHQTPTFQILSLLGVGIAFFILFTVVLCCITFFMYRSRMKVRDPRSFFHFFTPQLTTSLARTPFPPPLYLSLPHSHALSHRRATILTLVSNFPCKT